MPPTRTAAARGPSDGLDRLDGWLLGGAVALVVVAGVVGQVLQDRGVPVHAGAAPLQGSWTAHVGAGSLLAPAVALVVVLGARRLTRLRWSTFVLAAMVGSAAWVLALALVDGWRVGVVDRLTRGPEYLTDLPRVGSLGPFFRHFTDSILATSPDPWTTHVSSHPPVAMLPFWLLDRVGLSGGMWAGLLCVVVGASAVGAVLVAVRALRDEAGARRLAPFVVLAPAAIWVGVSADGIFLGVTAWGIALVALGVTSASDRRGTAYAAAGGLLLGVALYLSYGLVLALLVAGGLLLWRRSARLAAATAAGVGVVVLVVTLAGFDWWRAGHLVTERYYSGWGGERPYGYWVWADLAVFVLVVGPATVVGTGRLLRRSAAEVSPLRLDGVRVLVAGTWLAVVLASLGGLSKGEVERIWLPFAVWAMVACVALPPRRATALLVAQVVLALAVQHLVLTPW